MSFEITKKDDTSDVKTLVKTSGNEWFQRELKYAVLSEFHKESIDDVDMSFKEKRTWLKNAKTAIYSQKSMIVWHTFQGDDYCEKKCKGWDGSSRRCHCTNRRVEWNEISGKAEAY